MKVAYFIDTSSSVNWGGQATSAGMRHLVQTSYPDADFTPVRIRKLPFKNATFLRRILDHLILWAVKKNHLRLLKALLSSYGIDANLYSQFDVVCFNGEGAIHDNSGHVFRLLGALYAFKKSGARVYALNQTVDVNPNGLSANIIKAVYPYMDRVAVREPRSYYLMKKMGLFCELIGDAAYALPIMTTIEREERFARMNIKRPFIAVTASSFLKRNKESVAKVDFLLTTLKSLNLDLLFLANTKTDLHIARALQPRHGLRVVDYEMADYRDAIAIISMATLMVGGRQHPNIFAAKYGVPFIGLEGNTHKMRGVAELLNYPLPIFNWDFDKNLLLEAARRALDSKNEIAAIPIPVVDQIDLSSTVLKV
jgi:polysaccharide pyruvyl transferase WcaK-like protein